MAEQSLTREITIRKTDDGVGIATFLSRRFTYQSREQWEAHIRAGRVAVNGSPESLSGGADIGQLPELEVHEGDRVSFTPPEYEEPPVDTGWTALFEDADFLFVNKPPLLPCHPAGVYFRNTLLELVRERLATLAAAEPERAPISLHLVNRIDRETSGIVVLAKHPAAAAFGAKAMADRSAEKEYAALVEGTFPSGSGCGAMEARGWLERDVDSPVRKKLRFIRDDGADEARAEAKGAARGRHFVHTSFFGAGSVTLAGEHCARNDRVISIVRARLHTGKTHQIRATLQGLGYPLVGDKLYGLDPEIFLRFAAGSMTEGDRSLLRMPHQALHCSRVVMPSMKGSPYAVEAPTPASWIATARATGPNV